MARENQGGRGFFVNHALNVQVVNNGPLRAVSRKGTTTIYYHPEGGANFADPVSFAVGIPIQASDYDQLVMIDPSVSFPFLTTHLNTITSTESFVLNGEMRRLGHEHGAWRTHYLGLHNVGTSPVTGYFLGYAVGVSKDQIGAVQCCHSRLPLWPAITQEENWRSRLFEIAG